MQPATRGPRRRNTRQMLKGTRNRPPADELAGGRTPGETFPLVPSGPVRHKRHLHVVPDSK